MPKLIALRYSPWSEKARWALDHHGVAYTEVAHTPMIGELALRRAAKRWSGRVTVPVFVDEAGLVLTDSFDIAKHAERTGKGAPLFPPSEAARIDEWNARSERAMAGARGWIANRLTEDRAALLETLPRFARSLGPVATSMGRMGMRFFQRKYDLASNEAGMAVFKETLDAARAALKNARPHVFDRFSYADISIAVLLQAVVPVDARYIRLGPATREAWTNHALATEYADLVAWRDRLYEQDRPRRHERASA